MRKTILFYLFIALLLATNGFSQNIHEYEYNVNNGWLSNSYNTPGNIIYPVGYSRRNVKTPVVFVHGITGKVSNSYKANIEQAINYQLNTAFVQLNPLGTPEQNGKLLKRMIDHITAHYGVATVSIVAHSKGGMDTERALYGRNPYNTSIPSFGYEKVDGVYTFSSPVRGARVADVGAALSWTGVAFIAMWYANGYYLTSGSVNSFHDWAKSWRINSNNTFRNAYHPNGASYSRINMTEDNTTRWWAHQSDDPCYQNIWYYCYVGNGFHHSAGAYYDAYWQWAGFNSGWRNWHTSNDGFISEYRAKRSVITDNSNALTPGAGDSNYRVTHDANHTSLWERGENHFSNEVAPYLHYGLYNVSGRPAATNDITDMSPKQKVEGKELSELIMGSNGFAYVGKNSQSDFVIEHDNQPINIIFYTAQPVKQFSLQNNSGNVFTYSIIDSKHDNLSGTEQAVAHVENLPKGVYTLTLPVNEFIAMTSYDDSKVAFAVNMHFKESDGYNGQNIEVAIADAYQNIDLSQLELSANLSLISSTGDTPVSFDKIQAQTYQFEPVNGKPGHFMTHFDNLTPGAVYAMQLTARVNTGNQLLARNLLNTFYVHQTLPVQIINVVESTNAVPEITSGMVSIYPNPAQHVVNLYIEKNQDAKIHIYDVTGKQVYQADMTAPLLKLDISQWQKGIYLVKIKSENSLITKQLLVK